MRVLVKIGGSLIAPKDRKGIDYNYLFFISSFLKKFIYKFMIIHGTGNIGHGWVEKLISTYPGCDRTTLLKRDYSNGRIMLDKFFWQIDRYFGYKRIELQKFLEFPCFKDQTIIGGDVLKTGNIISSDDIFKMVLTKSEIDLGLILTDVDGILDKNGCIVSKISKNNLSKINFWEKAGDVTGGMKAKVEKLLGLNKKIVICNGKDFANISKWLNLGMGKGTVLT